MDKIQKFVVLLTAKERLVFIKILADIRALKLAGYDTKPLKGYKGYFRLRKGKIRIVFAKNDNGIGIIINVAHRKDVYRGL